MIVKTNVKLNLGLSVLRKRADGFHDIETLFVPCFDFGDTIEIITGDDYSRSSAALFAKYGAPDGRFDASTGSVTGRLSDERYARMSATCEAEQQTLEKRVAELQILMDGAKQKSMNVFRVSTTLLAQ